MLSVIMQPTYLPWVGYFDLMDQCDVFVFLDDVQFAKRGWQQRNRIRTQNGLEWLTVPVLTKGRRDQTLLQAKLDSDGFVQKHCRQIRQNYCKTPYFEKYIDEFEAIVMRAAQTGLLCEVNIQVIEWLKEKFGISCELRRSSEFEISEKRSKRLVSILEHLECSEYLSPLGSLGYLLEDSAIFEEAGVNIRMQKYTPVAYEQYFSPFIPYAAAIDLLFAVGPAALDVIREGNNGTMTLQEAEASAKEDV